MSSALPPKPQVDEASGQQSLHQHIIDKANEARLRYGPYWDYERICNMLADKSCIRFPVEIIFSAEQLEPGEFAYMHHIDSDDSDAGFVLYIHPFFQGRDDVLPHLIAYHLIVVNYGDIAGTEEAELYGSTLLNIDQEEYYRCVCECADQIR